MQSTDSDSLSVMKKWIYVGYVRAHSHDVRALTVAVPISREGFYYKCFCFFIISLPVRMHTSIIKDLCFCFTISVYMFHI